MSKETYLGDGLYASFDGGSIKLRAPRESGDHVVYLEYDLYTELATFADRCWNRKPDGIVDRDDYDNAPTDPHHGGKIWNGPR